MIKQSDVIKVGVFTKPHGVSGEIRLEFEGGAFEEIPSEYIICDMEGILVPFFIESYRLSGGNTGYVKFQRVDNLAYANRFSNVTAYLPNDVVDEEVEENIYDELIGFRLHDETKGDIGVILAIDETTSNVLFVVDYNGQEILIPLHEDLIEGIDSESKIIYVDLPEGLTDLDSLD